MQRILDEHCHHIPAEEVLGILGVDPAKGLDLFEVDHRRERFGPNLLKEKGPESGPAVSAAIPHRLGSPISGRAAVFHSQQGDVVADRIVAAPFIECADQGVKALR